MGRGYRKISGNPSVQAVVPLGRKGVGLLTLVDRIGRLIRANLNDLLRRAEDPEKIIEQALMDMKGALREAREQAAAAMAEGKRLEREVESHLKEAALWEEKAKEALGAGREDLAKEALKRRKRALDLAEGFR